MPKLSLTCTQSQAADRAYPPVGKRQVHEFYQLLLQPSGIILSTTHSIHDSIQTVGAAVLVQDDTHDLWVAIEVLPQLRQGKCSAAPCGAESLESWAEDPLQARRHMAGAQSTKRVLHKRGDLQLSSLNLRT